MENEEERGGRAGPEERQAERQVDVNVAFFVGVQSGSNELPDLPEHVGAGDDQA